MFLDWEEAGVSLENPRRKAPARWWIQAQGHSANHLTTVLPDQLENRLKKYPQNMSNSLVSWYVF